MMEYLDALVQTNDIKCLPKDVQEKYIINDCYVYVDDIWDFYEELKNEIVETIAEINDKVSEYKQLVKCGNEEAAEQLFWDDEESLKSQSYYYNNLCGYSITTIKPFKQYIEKINKEKNNDIFVNNKEDLDENDLSWLEDL